MKQSIAELIKTFEEKYNEADAAEARMRAVAEVWALALEMIQDLGDEEGEPTEDDSGHEDLAAANDTIAKLERENGRLGDRLSAADAKIELLIQDKTRLLLQIEKTEAQLAAKEADVVRLTENSLELHNQRNAAMDEVRMRRKENEQLTRERDSLRGLCDQLESQYARVQGENNAMCRRINSLEKLSETGK